MADASGPTSGLFTTMLGIVTTGVVFVVGWAFRMQNAVNRHDGDIQTLKDEYGVLATKEDVEKIESAQVDRHAENTRALEHITKRIDQIYLRRSDRRED